MNNAELEKLLKAAAVPKGSPDYWEQFPRRITAALHWRAQRPTAHDIETARLPGFGVAAWGVGLATACVILGLAFGLWRKRETGITPAQLAVAQKCYYEIDALFPNQLQTIIFGEQGPRVVLADKPNLPNATPIYVCVGGARGCQRFITFSGQQIRLNGETCDVLLNAAGNVLLVGRRLVWSNEWPMSGAGGYRIAARIITTK